MGVFSCHKPRTLHVTCQVLKAKHLFVQQSWQIWGMGPMGLSPEPGSNHSAAWDLFFLHLRAQAAEVCGVLFQREDHRRPVRPEGADAPGLDAVGSEWVGSQRGVALDYSLCRKVGQGSAENLAVHKQRGDDIMRFKPDFKRNAGARKLACAQSMCWKAGWTSWLQVFRAP